MLPCMLPLHASSLSRPSPCPSPAAEEELQVTIDDVVGRCRVVPQGYPTGAAPPLASGLPACLHY